MKTKVREFKRSMYLESLWYHKTVPPIFFLISHLSFHCSHSLGEKRRFVICQKYKNFADQKTIAKVGTYDGQSSHKILCFHIASVKSYRKGQFDP